MPLVISELISGAGSSSQQLPSTRLAQHIIKSKYQNKDYDQASDSDAGLACQGLSAPRP